MATVAFVSTYTPQRCGIATFTRDLASAVGPYEVVALHPDAGPAAYPTVVRHRIRRDERGDYLRTADAINASGVDAVSVQFEYGIWGGPDGAYVLDFVQALRVPVVTTLHTVLRSPTPSQRLVLTRLVALSDTTVVMSGAAASLLTRTYDVQPGGVRVVPHGVPQLPLVDPDTVKPRLDLAGRLVILSFGLLGPGKGYESVISAMPAVTDAVPSALYVVLGATHPNLLRHEGEAYRRRLEASVDALDVTGNVRFVDQFVSSAELGTWLQAADVFVTPYPNLDQIVSGTLSYAMGAGKAVVSTPYAYAREQLAGGCGRLVPPDSTPALAAALVDLLGDRDGREAMGRRAYAYSRRMTWPTVGAEYAALFDEAARSAVPLVPVMAARMGAGAGHADPSLATRGRVAVIDG